MQNTTGVQAGCRGAENASLYSTNMIVVSFDCVLSVGLGHSLAMYGLDAA